jgi:hypothetical protein
MTGALRFARYAFPPNELGYCGPDDPDALLEQVAGGHAEELARRARAFDGAWPYLELIAAANRVGDPLDERVVEAYWVGNALLRSVPPALVVASIEARFRRAAGTRWPALADALPPLPLPHHGLHVFGVYPWVGLLRSPARQAALHVLDRCRVRWGTVVDVAGDHALVRSRPLVFDDALALGAPQVERVRVADRGYRLPPRCAPGDTVALHWDWVCEPLTAAALGWLQRLTVAQVAAANRIPVGA